MYLCRFILAYMCVSSQLGVLSREKVKCMEDRTIASKVYGLELIIQLPELTANV